MKKTIAVALSAFFALTLLFWAVGCKKTETKNDLSNSESQQAIAAFKAKFNSDRITTTYVLNQKIKIPRNERSSLQGASVYGANVDEVILESWGITYVCNSGYIFWIKYNMTFECASVLASKLSMSLRLKNSGGTIVYPTITTPNDFVTVPLNSTDLENLGASVTYPTGTSFRMTYSSQVIPSSIYTSATIVEHSIFARNFGCGIILNIPNFDLTVNTPNSTFYQPCSRIDKVYINPRNGSTAGSFGAVLAATGCSLPNYIYPQKQHIQWRTAGSSTWPTANDYLLNNFDVIVFPGAIGSYEFRYRNENTSSASGGACFGPWSSVESWPM